MSARWMALVDAAITEGRDPDDVPSSPFLEETADELTERLRANARFTWCQHVRTSADLGELPDIIAWPASAYGTCIPCAVDFRHELESSRRRTCERCDEARASAVHRADFGVIPGIAVVWLAIRLCEACAAEEGLRTLDGAGDSEAWG